MIPKPKETFEEFKLRFFKARLKHVLNHQKVMLAHRANANLATLGMLDASEDISQEKIDALRWKIRLLTAPNVSLGAITQDQIATAKMVPISVYLKVPPHKKVKCLFHDDKVPSMHIYGTRYHCFVCEAYGTTIDVVMKLRCCSFVDAVKLLNNC